jgi:hypothetical protein
MRSKLAKLISGGMLLALLGLLLTAFVMPIARADDGNALVKGLTSDGFYISEDVRNELKRSGSDLAKNSPNLESDVRNAVSKVKGKNDIRVAVVSNAITVPAEYKNGSQINGQAYASFLLNFMSNPKPDAVVFVNAEERKVYLVSNSLSDAERKAITDGVVSTFASKGIGEGTALTIQQASDKLSGNATGGLIGTIATVVVILLVLGGAGAYMWFSTKKTWKDKVGAVQRLASQVSDQVVRISDEVNFLPEAAQVRSSTDFGSATQNFSDANASLRELETVSPITLLLKGAEYERKLNLTRSQFEQTGHALNRVEQMVGRTLPS